MISLEDVNITTPQAKTSMYVETAIVKIMRTIFRDMNKNSDSKQGAAITCISCREINITNSTFRNVKSKIGGAIYIEETENNKKITDR